MPFPSLEDILISVGLSEGEEAEAPPSKPGAKGGKKSKKRAAAEQEIRAQGVPRGPLFDQLVEQLLIERAD